MPNTFLFQLGFSEKEILIYLAILRAGKITPGSLALTTKLKRTTIYHIAEELLQKGIIAEDLTRRTRTFYALPPEELERLLRKDEESLQARRKLVEQAVQELRETSLQAGIALPKINYVGEEDINRFLYKRTPNWNESIRQNGGVWWGYSDPTFVELYQDWIRWYWKQKSSADILDRLLTSPAPIETAIAQENIERRQVKFWPGGEGFTGSQWVAGDYLIIVMTSRHPYYLLEIHDAVQAHNMQIIMRGLWETLS